MKKSKLKNTGILRNLSASFMGVIAIMPICGLMLGIGSVITSNSHVATPLYIFGTFTTNIGNVLFGNLGVFFCVSIVVVFTRSHLASISALFGYLLFSISQVPFISDNGDNSFNLFWYHNVNNGILATNLGYNSLNTSVFGGVVVGLLVVFLFKKFKDTKLPNVFSFFEGIRLIPMIIIIPVIIFSFIIMFTWPLFGLGLEWFGSFSGTLPIGLDSFFVGLIWRLLMPFGLHHAFYSLFWFTQAGGFLQGNFHMGGPNGITLHDWLANHGYNDVNYPIGDQKLWTFMLSHNIPFNTVFYDSSGHIVNGINPGRFLNCNFPFMIGGLPAACFAMILCAPKENRKMVIGILGSGIATSMLIGVTEPILFSFLFASPFILFGFHSIMAAVGAMLQNILHVHTGAMFSCGILDMIMYGIIPMHLVTNWWWSLVIAAGFAPVYFAYFYFMINKFNIATPGRAVVVPIAASNGTIKISANTTEKSEIESNELSKEEKIAKIIISAIGKENIDQVSFCATRLRLVVKDSSKINQALMRQHNLVFVVSKDKIQIIFGTTVTRYYKSLQKLL